MDKRSVSADVKQKGETASERIAARSLRVNAQENNKRFSPDKNKSTENQTVIEIDSDNDENTERRISSDAVLLQGKEKQRKVREDSMPISTWNIGQMQGHMMHFTTSSNKNIIAPGMVPRTSSHDDIVAASYNIAARGNDFVGGAIGMLPSEGVDVETCSTENSDEEGYGLQQMTSENRYFASNNQYIVAGNGGKNQTVWSTFDGQSGDPKLGTYGEIFNVAAKFSTFETRFTQQTNILNLKQVTASSGRNGQPVMQTQQSGIEGCGESPGFSGRQQLLPVMTNNGLSYQMPSTPDMYYRQYSGNQGFPYGDNSGLYSPTMVYRGVPGSNLRNMKVVNVSQLPEQGRDSDVWQPQDDSDDEGQDESDGRQSVCSDQQPVAEKRRRKKREPKKEKVKRPMNAFMVWAKKARAKVAQSFQAINNADVSVKLGETWSNMTPEEKQPYFDEANKIKEQHKRDHPDWVYQPKPKRKRTTGSGVTSLFAVTVNARGNAVRHINTYKHANAGLVFQNEASNLQVLPVMSSRYNNVQNPCNAIRLPVQMQTGSVVMATPSQISQLQQQGIIQQGNLQTLNLDNQQVLQMQGNGNVHFQMFNNGDECQGENIATTSNNDNEDNIPCSENENILPKEVLQAIPQTDILEE